MRLALWRAVPSAAKSVSSRFLVEPSVSYKTEGNSMTCRVVRNVLFWPA
jgi:hypothetical protein